MRAGRRVGLVAAGSGESLLSDHVAGAEPGGGNGPICPTTDLRADGFRSAARGKITPGTCRRTSAGR